MAENVPLLLLLEIPSQRKNAVQGEQSYNSLFLCKGGSHVGKLCGFALCILEKSGADILSVKKNHATCLSGLPTLSWSLKTCDDSPARKNQKQGERP